MVEVLIMIIILLSYLIILLRILRAVVTVVSSPVELRNLTFVLLNQLRLRFFFYGVSFLTKNFNIISAHVTELAWATHLGHVLTFLRVFHPFGVRITDNDPFG